MLKKVFMLRHQAHGILTDKVYFTPPTEADVAAAQELMAKLHGDKHDVVAPDGYWMKVHEATVEVPEGFSVSSLPDADPPAPPPNGLGADGEAALPRFVVSATGEVKNP